MIKNTASQAIGCQMITAADGSAFTGSVTVYVCGDAGSQALGSVGSGVCTHEGNGYHTYAPAQAETNYNLIAFTFIGSGAIPATVQVFTIDARQTGDSFARIGSTGSGLTSLATAAICTEGRLAELDAANLPTDIAAIPTTAMRGTDNAALASVCTEGRLAELDAANLPADVDTLLTRITAAVALASVCTEGRLAELDAANLPTDIAAIPTTAEIKTAMEAAGSDLHYLITGLINKMIITEADGNTEQFSDTDVSLGSIAAAFSTDGTYTTRKRLVI